MKWLNIKHEWWCKTLRRLGRTPKTRSITSTRWCRLTTSPWFGKCWAKCCSKMRNSKNSKEYIDNSSRKTMKSQDLQTFLKQRPKLNHSCSSIKAFHRVPTKAKKLSPISLFNANHQSTPINPGSKSFIRSRKTSLSHWKHNWVAKRIRNFTKAQTRLT